MVNFSHSIWKNLHRAEKFTQAPPVAPVTNIRYVGMPFTFPNPAMLSCDLNFKQVKNGQRKPKSVQLLSLIGRNNMGWRHCHDLLTCHAIWHHPQIQKGLLLPRNSTFCLTWWLAICCLAAAYITIVFCFSLSLLTQCHDKHSVSLVLLVSLGVLGLPG